MTTVAEILHQRLSQGVIPAAEVMQLALYHPQEGYYRQSQNRWGFEGRDYYTALDCGPLLGQTLALRLEDNWKQLGSPSSYTVLEPGAGRGWLGRDILSHVSPSFLKTFTYLHRDDSPAAQNEAKQVLAPWIQSGRAVVTDHLDSIQPFVGAIFSNELFDALPAQPWRWDGSQWLQEVLSSEGSEWHSADAAEAGQWFASQAEDLEAGDGSIWAEGLTPLVHLLAQKLTQGIMIAIDYGESADRLLAKGADLRRYRQHQVDGKWWEDIGQYDLTADVDFTRLQACWEHEGFHTLAHQPLSHWIRRHALLETWEAVWAELPSEQKMRQTHNVLQLTLPGLLGERFRVLEGHR